MIETSGAELQVAGEVWTYWSNWDMPLAEEKSSESGLVDERKR